MLRRSLIFLVLLSAGCVSLDPHYSTPESPIPATWPGAQGQGKAISHDWQQVIHDPRLQQVVTIALNSNRDVQKALADIEARAEEILKDGKFPLLLGGEHLVTLGAVRAAVKKYPDLHIVHFDAHADLRDDYLGAKLSHACVLRRCHELVGDGHIHQFCIRSGDRAEFEFAAQHTEMHKFDFTGLAELTEQLCKSKVPVYLTIDLDCLDPSCFPGTGTPEAGGVSFLQLLDAIRTVTSANIIGADLNELAPTLDTTGVSTATACKVLRELLIALDKGWPGFQV